MGRGRDLRSLVTTTGHAGDADGEAGERRAQTVRKYLVQLGIDGSRLKTVSYGSEMPAVVGNSDTSHDKNRRAEFAVTQ